MLFIWKFHNVTLVAPNDFELTSRLMSLEILLEHLSFTAEVGALDHEVVALVAVLLEVGVADDLGAALVGILARGLDHRELLGKEGMWFNKSHIGRAARWTHDSIVTLHQRVDVVIDTLLTETFAASTALSRLQHNVLAQQAI